jgi:hypothetical protein
MVNGNTVGSGCHQQFSRLVNMESVAPGPLESIRALLNTWSIPNDTRRPVGDLPRLFADRMAWAARMPDLRYPRHDADRRAIERLRGQLRASLTNGDAAAINDLVSARRWRLSVDADNLSLRWFVEPPSAAGDGLAIVVAAVAARTWSRLRACPDCQWVFYDTSRNGQRTWCSMTAADGARGCGSIAKTRAYRRRLRESR